MPTALLHGRPTSIPWSTPAKPRHDLCACCASTLDLALEPTATLGGGGTCAPACRLRTERPIRRCAFWASPAAPCWSLGATHITRIVQGPLASAAPAGAKLLLDGFCRSWWFWRNRENRALHGLGQLGHQRMHVGVQRKPLDRATGRTHYRSRRPQSWVVTGY